MYECVRPKGLMNGGHSRSRATTQAGLTLHPWSVDLRLAIAAVALGTSAPGDLVSGARFTRETAAERIGFAGSADWPPRSKAGRTSRAADIGQTAAQQFGIPGRCCIGVASPDVGSLS